MHRGKVANALLLQIMKEQKAEILNISEHYAQMNNGSCFKTRSNMGPAIEAVPHKNSETGKGFVWMQIDNLMIISCYLTSSDIIKHLQANLIKLKISQEARRKSDNSW